MGTRERGGSERDAILRSARRQLDDHMTGKGDILIEALGFLEQVSGAIEKLAGVLPLSGVREARDQV